ncbi:MAG: hypothetical protein RLZZ628_3215 [Bacteroidota bacterium]|jgi:hypothetical protein
MLENIQKPEIIRGYFRRTQHIRETNYLRPVRDDKTIN